MNPRKENHYKGQSKPGHCMVCARKLNPDKTVWLELDQRTDTFTNTDDVPSEHSQGCFEFGQDCAERELNLTAFKRLEKGIPFERMPTKVGQA